MFKQAFKHFKSKATMPDLQEVIDLDKYEKNNIYDSWCNLVKPLQVSEVEENIHVPIGLNPQIMWRCYLLQNHPGLLIIRNAFTCYGQRYWIARSLRDFSKAPNIVNLNSKMFPPSVISDWWKALYQTTDLNLHKRLKIAMRWATLGYHHNWDTKIYNKENRTEFPKDLTYLSEYFSVVLGYTNFLPQAAIVNYYPIGSHLSGHTDHSELNHTAPLFSFSFGQTAIFLIGGTTLDDRPTALYLRSGDILVMSNDSRLSYHAIPRVMTTELEPWNNLVEMSVAEGNHKPIISMDKDLWRLVQSECFWTPFNSYITGSRININVRQVFFTDD